VTMPRYLMELSFIRASFLKGSTSLQAILDRLQSGGGDSGDVPLETTPSPRPVAPPAPGRKGRQKERSASDAVPGSTSPPVEPSESGGQSVQAGTDVSWSAVVERVDQSNHPLAIKLAEGRVEGFRAGALQVGFAVENPDFFIGSLRRNLKEVEEAVSTVAGRRIRVNFVAADVEEGDRIKTVADLRKEVSMDPIVQSAIELFDAKMVDVRPLEGLFENGGN